MEGCSDRDDSAAGRQDRISAITAGIRRFLGRNTEPFWGHPDGYRAPAACCTECGHTITDHDWFANVGWPCWVAGCRCLAFVLEDR